MQAITGVFTTASAARAAGDRLVAARLPGERITVLMPGASMAEVERAVPTTEGEAPGMGSAIGGVVGGATGAATGFGAAALASVLLPGVGAIGVLGTAAAVLGLTGVAAGVAAGDQLEDALSQGLPRDELFVYDDALRSGRSVVVALVVDDDEAARARKVLEEAGAESVDAARERWWVGLRSAEQEEYGEAFEADEPRYRQGFEAAVGGETRGATYEDALPRLERRHASACRDPAFRRGYERGAEYDRRMQQAMGAAGPSRRRAG
jgi:hypothetical protein